MKQPYFIGITGGSGAGKTQVLHWLKEAFEPGQLCFVSQDNYYAGPVSSYQASDTLQNFDDPSVIEAAQFAADLRKLKAGQVVERPEYAFNNPVDRPNVLTFTPAPVVLVEGIFVFHFPEIRQLLDLKVFVDAKEHLKLHRRITRDQLERGYALEDILFIYNHHVVPAFEKYIEPYRDEADFIIPNNKVYQNNEIPIAIHILVAFLKTKTV